MTISKALSIFVKQINNVDALNNPQKFLGSNINKLLEFWSLLDTLTEEQWETIKGRYRHFFINHYSEWDKAVDEAYEASEEIIGEELANHAALAVDYAVYEYGAACCATMELIGGRRESSLSPDVR